jgi:ferrous iron transport protein B
VIWDSRRPIILQVADAKNLRRSLLITLPLLELGLPYHLNLNMIDEAKSRGIVVDAARLANLLGIGVTETVATRRQGLDRLRRGIGQAKSGEFRIDYGPVVEEAIEATARFLPQGGMSPRGLAMMILAGDKGMTARLFAAMPTQRQLAVMEIADRFRERLGEDPARYMNRVRSAVVDDIVRRVLTGGAGTPGRWRQWLGRAAIHPVWGIPVLAVVLFLIFEFVGVFGAGVCVNFLESVVFRGYVHPFLQGLFGLIPWPFFNDLMVGPYGIFTMAMTYAVAIVLPVVGTFFIAFGILEDSGYLPRLAFMVDRFFRVIGLNGKAVLPMVLGLGCDTMATLTSRILETRKERVLVTLLLALAVPCSAQLGVILGMLSGLSWKATAIWAGVILLVMFLVGFLYSRLFPGKRSDFVLEIPPMRLPQLSNILTKTVARIEWYLREAVPLFVIGTLVLFILDKIHALEGIETAMAPIVTGLVGLPREAAGLFMLARQGALDPIQIVVSLVTITLFVPCIANFLIIIKERGVKTALAITGFIVPFAFIVGGVLNWVLRASGVSL